MYLFYNVSMTTLSNQTPTYALDSQYPRNNLT